MTAHVGAPLGAYVLGILDPRAQAEVRAHLGECAACLREVDELRDIEAALGEIPPEAFLDGPPADGDTLLVRALEDVRSEQAHSARRRTLVFVLAGVFLLVVAAGGGLLLGRRNAPADAGPPVWVGSAGGVTMAVSVDPAAGWVRVHASVAGVPPGSQCRLFVVGRDGSRAEAAGWVADGSASSVDGSALMAPADVASVQAETLAGQILVDVGV